MKQTIINACKQVIDLYEGSEKSLADAMMSVKVNDMSIADVTVVHNAVWYYYIKEPVITNGKDVTPYELVKMLKNMDSLCYGKDILYYQINVLERWGYETKSNNNAEFFDSLLKEIIQGNAKDVLTKLYCEKTSGFKPCTYKDIANDNVNCSSERIVYDDFTYIVTASSTSITLYRKLTDKELKEYDEEEYYASYS